MTWRAISAGPYFVAALGQAGGVPRRWRWHKLLLAPQDARSVTLVLPAGRADSFTPAPPFAADAPLARGH
jgi:hypothetical protein